MLGRKAEGSHRDQQLANTTKHTDCAKLAIPFSRFLPLGDHSAAVFHDKKQPLREQGSLRTQEHARYKGSAHKQLCQRQAEGKSCCLTSG